MALFALGFRPFYLLAGAFAAVAVALRAMQYTGWTPRMDSFWHAHEMVFGFAFAVIAGFLLTAVRVWTQRETVTGLPLAGMALLWLAARVLAFFSLPAAVAFDALFAVAVAVAIGRPLVASGNRRNWFFIALVLAIGAGSVAFYLEPRLGLAIGLDIVLFVIAVMAGRVVPMFTNNAIPGADAGRNPWAEKLALGSLLALIACDALALDAAAAAVAAVAAVAHAVRFALWHPWRTLGKPIVWILHVSYAWVVVHLALRGLAFFEFISPSLATHALTVGAIGGITLGMMTRTARGHTGRPLDVGAAEVTAYMLIQAAAAARVLMPLFFPSLYLWSIAVAAAFWTAAFAIFTVFYIPILTRPRLDGKPG
jgi:uncharacterized protein involved in response to NO